MTYDPTTLAMLAARSNYILGTADGLRRLQNDCATLILRVNAYLASTMDEKKSEHEEVVIALGDALVTIARAADALGSTRTGVAVKYAMERLSARLERQ